MPAPFIYLNRQFQSYLIFSAAQRSLWNKSLSNFKSQNAFVRLFWISNAPVTSNRCHIIEVSKSKISKHLNDYYNIRDQITTHRQKQQAKPTNTIEVISNVSYVNKNTGHRQARSNKLFMFCKIFCRFKRLNAPLMVTAKSLFVPFSFKRKNTKTAVGIVAQVKSCAPAIIKTLLGISLC